MVTPKASHVISAKRAAECALITYRQLDHWATQGWVTPSVQSASGRGRRRLYSVEDVLRLAALRHFAKAGWPITSLGQEIEAVSVTEGAWLVTGTESGLVAVEDDDALTDLLQAEEQFSVFDLRPLRTRLTEGDGEHEPAADVDNVRRLA